MFQLGCNYSPELMELLDKKQVEIDWIKISDSSRDAHLNMRKEDFAFLETALSFTNPRIVTLEYGSEEKRCDIELLNHQLNCLRQILG